MATTDDQPIGQPVASSRWPVSPLVGTPFWAASRQEAPSARSASAGGWTRPSTEWVSTTALLLPASVVDTRMTERVQPVGRLRAGEVQVVDQGLTERDRAILRTFEVVQLLTGNQLERLHFSDNADRSRERRRRDVLGRLVAARALERLPRRVGGVRAGSGGFVFGLGAVGERLLENWAGDRRQGVYRRRWRGGVGLVAHTLGVSDVYVRALEAERDDLIGAVSFRAEPFCWQQITPPGDNYQAWTLKPDGLLTFQVRHRAEHWFVEVDRGTESVSTLRKKMDAYEAAWDAGLQIDGVMPRVWWNASR